MGQVNFYILQNSIENARQQLACRLTEKAYHLGHQIYIHTDSESSSQQLDELLWSFRAASFLPHALQASSSAEPIAIGHTTPPESGYQVLINLGSTIPDFFNRFERVIEIVENGETERQDGRQRFKEYRQQGIDPATHNLSL